METNLMLRFLFFALFLGFSVPTAIAVESRGLSVPLKASEAQDAKIIEEVQLYSESYALVIGIDDYNVGWPRLSMAVKDAKSIAEALETKGFDVTLKLNLNSRQLRDTLEEFYLIKGENPDARLFVWFAGHGHSQEGEGFLIPTDAPKPSAGGKFYRKAMSLRRIGEYVRLAASKHSFAVFDSCFSGTVFEAARALPPVAVTRATTLPVRQFLTSGDAGQIVSDNGTFRELFIRALNGEEKADANGDNFLTASELGLFLTDRVTNLTKSKQTPRYGKLRDKDWDRGDFVFSLPRRPTKAAARIAAQTAPSANRGAAEAAKIEQETVFWESIKDSGDAGLYRAYLDSFPTGTFAPIAKAKLAETEAQEARRQKALEDERQKLAAERARLTAEAEARRKADEATRQKAIAKERKRLAAERARLAAEAEARRKADEAARQRAIAKEHKRLAAEAVERKKTIDAEKRRLADEAKRLRAEQEVRFKAALKAERKRLAMEAEKRREAEKTAKKMQASKADLENDKPLPIKEPNRPSVEKSQSEAKSQRQIAMRTPPNAQEQLKGARWLNSEEIKLLISGNIAEAEGSRGSYSMKFAKNGELEGTHDSGHLDWGKWRIDVAGNLLCRVWDEWDDNRDRCSRIYFEGNTAIMFGGRKHVFQQVPEVLKQ
jgi:hypothetical protein